MTDKIIVAYLETPNFEFQAFATTEDEAMELMQKAWKKHRQQTGATGLWSYFRPDVYFYEIEVGKCYRDKEEMS